MCAATSGDASASRARLDPQIDLIHVCAKEELSSAGLTGTHTESRSQPNTIEMQDSQHTLAKIG